MLIQLKELNEISMKMRTYVAFEQKTKQQQQILLLRCLQPSPIYNYNKAQNNNTRQMQKRTLCRFARSLFHPLSLIHTLHLPLASYTTHSLSPPLDFVHCLESNAHCTDKKGTDERERMSPLTVRMRSISNECACVCVRLDWL